MFSPTIGRCISQDPIGFDAGDVNLYRFVESNPTNATDPSGLAPFIAPHALAVLAIYGPYTKQHGGNVGMGAAFKFTNIKFEWDGVKYQGDVQIRVTGERRFLSTVAAGDDSIPTNFSVFLRLKYSFTKLKCADPNAGTDDFEAERLLPIRLVGIFIAPTVNAYVAGFKPTSFDKFEEELIAGTKNLPTGHKKP